ncbi:MAG: RagB/SusD family nutrient uptake outer membrane protein, partial [Firmicutes bacterium]|nr:RagB/SusD family nutrient uptake outer membrane protein [Bacillota bacterium]
MKKIIKYFFIMVASAGLMTSCDLDIAPEDSLTGDQMTQSPTGILDILNGCYAVMKDYPENSSSNNWYGRQYYQMSDFSSDDVVYGHATTDELNMIFKFEERHAGLSNVASFWSQSYKIIYSANVALDVISKDTNPTDETNSLHGEALFLKAYVMHSLVRFYAKPYKEATAANEPGLIIREDGSDAQPKGRASLKETYDYIVDCLLEAEKLMSTPVERSESRCFASVGAVRALLSRVYLYMGNWDKCIEYSTKVIGDSNYEIAGPSEFADYFKSTWTSKETIWCLKMLTQDDKGSGSVASMIMKADGCWGEEGYSEPLLEDMGRGTSLETDDIRWTFVCDVNTKNGLDLIPCSKLSWQDGKPTL